MSKNLRDALKHNLIPTEENKFHPRFFHAEIFSIFLALAVFLQIFVYSGVTTRILSTFPSLSNIAAVLPALLAAETNEYRLAQNTAPLKNNELLTKAAVLKAEDMAKRSYFSHIDPDGKKPWKWIEQVGYQYSYAGENLAVDFIDSKDVTDAWINSLTHRANLINKDFSEIGIGIAQGVFENKPTTFVVQFLARPAHKTNGDSVPLASKTPITAISATSFASSNKSVVFATTTVLATTSVATTSLIGSTNGNGQVLGLESANTIGELFYSSKKISTATVETLIIFVICLLLLSYTYSIVHHPAPSLVDRIKLALISHKKVFIYSFVFIITLCMLLIYIVSLESTVRI